MEVLRMKKLGFFGEDLKLQTSSSSLYFLSLGRAFERICQGLKLENYSSFEEMIKIESSKEEASFIWKWIQTDALERVKTIREIFNRVCEHDSFVDNLLCRETESLKEVLEESSDDFATDILTAGLDATAVYLKQYYEIAYKNLVFSKTDKFEDVECRNPQIKVSIKFHRNLHTGRLKSACSFFLINIFYIQNLSIYATR